MDHSGICVNLCYILLFACLSFSFSFGSVITVDGGGYMGIVVAIHKNVPEDKQIIENIKILFSRASTFLYNSTKNNLFFKEVIIVVPPTWSTESDYEILPGNFFSNAHVRVDAPNPEYHDTPYTLQPGGCGEPGQYIHLTPWFVKELHGKTLEMFGAPERQLVHEWAHLRYGVFDEYGIPGDKRYPMFYHEGGKIRPTSCVRDIKGWIESRDGGPCKMTADGHVDVDCIFIPNMHSNEAKASIMYMPFIPSMEGFCDDANHQHNVLAPTKHNSICNYRSTWDVMLQHSDFQNIRSKRDAATNELTETLFRVLQSPKHPTSRYVLVLDVSGSMNGQPMKLLHGAATRLVEDRIPDGAYLGIVQFSTEASILQNLTKVDNKTRIQLSKSLPDRDDSGRTAIGKGLKEAIKVLTNNNSSAEAGLIMLITDGEENVLPLIEDVLPEVLQHNVIINAVAFGNDASAKLENMTAVTGGRGYFFSNNGNRPASALDSAFLESITSQADIELQPVQLIDEMFTLEDTVITKHVNIDEELGKDTIFTITARNISWVGDVVLRSPSEDTYGSTYPDYSKDNESGQRIKIFLPVAEPGKWEVIIRRNADYPFVVAFAVTSEPKDIRDQPIRVHSWLNEIQLKFPAHAKVYAEVKKGYLAVVGATVLATVERPMGATIDIELKDDGLGADVTENDGIYTGYFTHFNGNGRYAVIARISNNGEAKLKQGIISSASPPIPILKGDETREPIIEFTPVDFKIVNKNETKGVEENFESKPASAFDRSSNPGAFRVESWTEDAGDVIPPGDISDLSVLDMEIIEEKELKVTLEFTTPGDDMNVGQVASLEMRASLDKEELIKNFEDSLLINESNLINGSLTPLPPGEKAILTVSIPEALTIDTLEPLTIHFGIIARDETGKTSSKTGIASATIASLIEEKPEILTTEIQEHKNPTAETDTGEDLYDDEMETKQDEENMTVSEQDLDDEDKNSDASTEEAVKEDISLIVKDNMGTAGKRKEGNASFLWWPVVVGVVLALSIIMIAVLVVVIIINRSQKKTYFSVRSQQC